MIGCVLIESFVTTRSVASPTVVTTVEVLFNGAGSRVPSGKANGCACAVLVIIVMSGVPDALCTVNRKVAEAMLTSDGIVALIWPDWPSGGVVIENAGPLV